MDDEDKETLESEVQSSTSSENNNLQDKPSPTLTSTSKTSKSSTAVAAGSRPGSCSKEIQGNSPTTSSAGASTTKFEDPSADANQSARDNINPSPETQKFSYSLLPPSSPSSSEAEVGEKNNQDTLGGSEKPEESLLTFEAAPLNSSKRCLWKADHDEIEESLSAELSSLQKKERIAMARKWNFDIGKEIPLPGDLWKWEKIHDGPSFYKSKSYGKYKKRPPRTEASCQPSESPGCSSSPSLVSSSTNVRQLFPRVHQQSLPRMDEQPDSSSRIPLSSRYGGLATSELEIVSTVQQQNPLDIGLGCLDTASEVSSSSLGETVTSLESGPSSHLCSSSSTNVRLVVTRTPTTVTAASVATVSMISSNIIVTEACTASSSNDIINIHDSSSNSNNDTFDIPSSGENASKHDSNGQSDVSHSSAESHSLLQSDSASMVSTSPSKTSPATSTSKRLLRSNGDHSSSPPSKKRKQEPENRRSSSSPESNDNNVDHEKKRNSRVPTTSK